MHHTPLGDFIFNIEYFFFIEFDPTMLNNDLSFMSKLLCPMVFTHTRASRAGATEPISFADASVICFHNFFPVVSFSFFSFQKIQSQQ